MKNYAAKVLSIVIPFAVSYGVVYLMGSLFNATFDLTAWTADSRFVATIFGNVYGIAVLVKLEKGKSNAS